MSRTLNSPTALSAPWRLSLLTCLILPALQMFAGTNVAQPISAPRQLPGAVKVINEGAANTIPGQYIVVFKPGTARDAVLRAEAIVKRLGGTVGFRYESALIGFSAKLPPGAVQALHTMPGVAWIEADQKVSINVKQYGAPAGLDRTSKRILPLDGEHTYHVNETGAGVHAYVIDTGIRYSHADFAPGRASGASGAYFDAFGGNGDDCGNAGTGHGTHVAGTIGGKDSGIAKDVTLHSVRVLDCGGFGSGATVIAGINWVTSNKILPAVANMSLGGGASPSIDFAVNNSIASGVVYVVAAGNSEQDACNFSPARVPAAITVGATEPANDKRASFLPVWGSNTGPCLDLFAPGVNILSAGNTSDSATAFKDGTSMAAPHVAGVAAVFLQNHPATNTAANQAAAWNKIHYNNNVPTTPGWAGIIDPRPGSPNELLHWGSLNDGYDDGDPHITTVDGTRYDFQGAGEFVTLRDGGGFEIQTRKSPVATAFNAWPNPHTGLASCVSVNTAVAARVGKHRVTFQPNLSGVPDPSGLQLRVDGVLTTLGAGGLALGPGGRVASSAGGGIQIDFPDGTALIATPGWWAAQSKWYINVSVLHTAASNGVMGAIAQGSWLPALPNGTSLGPKPASAQQRYADLNQKFADAWRVTNRTSLFDYAPGTSTATFTLRDWPREGGPCVVPERETKLAETVNPRAAQEVARQVCRPVLDKNANADCVFDVAATGEAGFAKTYLLSQQLRNGSTRTVVTDDKETTRVGEPVAFTATVTSVAGGKGVPTGVVEFTLDGERVGETVRLDSNGRAVWKTVSLRAGSHRVSATYVADRGSVFLSSISLDESHAVGGRFVGELDADTRPDKKAAPPLEIAPIRAQP
ncbi:MAG TPA: S8 family serine peptidase, partial [Pyrinomonadaceae bacterium]